MHFPRVLLPLTCLLLACSEGSKTQVGLSITDIRINRLALDAGKRFESPSVQKRVRYSTIDAAWKQFIPNSHVAFLDTLLQYRPLLIEMLQVLDRCLIYSLFPLKNDASLFFAFDASVDAYDRTVYAVIFPQASVVQISRFEEWFGKAILKDLDVELIMNPSHRASLVPILINSMVMARDYGLRMRNGIHHLDKLLAAKSPAEMSRILGPLQRFFQ